MSRRRRIEGFAFAIIFALIALAAYAFGLFLVSTVAGLGSMLIALLVIIAGWRRPPE